MHTTVNGSTNKINFQKRVLESLPVPRTGRTTVYDKAVRGLCLTVHPTGNRSFGWYRSVNGRPRFLNIGTFPDLSIEQAREQAEENNARLARWKSKSFDGTDPFGPRRDGSTLRDLLDDYCNLHLKIKSKSPERAIRDAKWHFSKYIPSWLDKKPGSIRRKQVKAIHAELASEVGIHTAARVVQVLSAVYNDALDRETFEGDNPAFRIKREKEPKRTRTLEPDEWPRFFKALLAETHVDLRDFVLLALFTGARRGDVLSMRWTNPDGHPAGRVQVDLKGKQPTWLVPDPKNKTPYTIQLPPEAADVLRKRKESSTSEWVFPNPSKTGHLLDMKKGWGAFLKRAAITDFRVHDLRHCHGSVQANLGISLPIIGKSLGHTSVAATQIYANVDAAPVRKSVGRAVKTMLHVGKVSRQKLLSAPRE